MTTFGSDGAPTYPHFRQGLIYAFASYGIWGLFPLYFAALMPANPFEVVVYRVVFSLLFCLVLIFLTRSWSRIVAIARQPRVLLTLGLAGLLIFVNWEVFIFAVYANRVVETSLGYFINPLVTVALGVTFYRERLRVMQWVAVGVGLIAVLVLSFGLGQVPWIALTLAISFGLYGFVKKRVGPRVNAIDGLAVESAWVTPLALVQFIVLVNVSGIGLFALGPWHAALMLFSGVLTAIPLMLFAAGAKRLPLSVHGLLQYLTPVCGFLLGVFVFHEEMPPARWAGFSLVWLAIVLLSIDMLRAARRTVADRNRVDEKLEPLPE